MIRVILPAHLRTLGQIGSAELELEVSGEVTIDSVLTALEARYPMLRGTIREHRGREHGGGARRPYVRFFACGEDWSFADPAASLPADVAVGKEPFLVVGAVSGGG